MPWTGGFLTEPSPVPRRTSPWGIQLWQSDGPKANQGLTPAASLGSGGPVHPYHTTTPTPSRGGPGRRRSAPEAVEDSFLVDSASSHMLVSKIKPCMSKYKQLYGETANGSLNQLSFI